MQQTLFQKLLRAIGLTDLGQSIWTADFWRAVLWGPLGSSGITAVLGYFGGFPWMWIFVAALMAFAAVIFIRLGARLNELLPVTGLPAPGTVPVSSSAILR
jgi:hypothetical protein